MPLSIPVPALDQWSPLLGLAAALIADTLLGCAVALRMKTFSPRKIGDYADLKPGTFRLALTTMFTLLQQTMPGSGQTYSALVIGAATAAAVSYTPTFLSDAKAKLIALVTGPAEPVTIPVPAAPPDRPPLA